MGLLVSLSGRLFWRTPELGAEDVAQGCGPAAPPGGNEENGRRGPQRMNPFTSLGPEVWVLRGFLLSSTDLR